MMFHHQQAITPPEILAPRHSPSIMPTAAAVAIAATTAKIQAMDAQQLPSQPTVNMVSLCCSVGGRLLYPVGYIYESGGWMVIGADGIHL